MLDRWSRGFTLHSKPFVTAISITESNRVQKSTKLWLNRKSLDHAQQHSSVQNKYRKRQRYKYDMWNNQAFPAKSIFKHDSPTTKPKGQGKPEHFTRVSSNVSLRGDSKTECNGRMRYFSVARRKTLKRYQPADIRPDCVCLGFVMLGVVDYSMF